MFLLMGASEFVDGQDCLVSMSKAGSKPRLILRVLWEQATLTEPGGSLFCPHPMHPLLPTVGERAGLEAGRMTGLLEHVVDRTL